MNQAARRGGLYFLAVLCLIASVALAAHLLVSGGVTVTPGGSHDIVTSAADEAPLKAPLDAASSGQSTDRSQDRHSPEGQQPAGIEESEDWPAKKFHSGLAALFAPFDVPNDYAVWKPEPGLIGAGSDDPPPQLLQRPPPAG